MKINLDLAKSPEESMPAMSPSNTKYYPTFHIDGKKEVDFPKEGTMTVRYCKVSHSESEDSQGTEHYSCTVEVREIVSVEAEKDNSPSKKYSNAADALDAIVKSLAKGRGEERASEDESY